ncbi:MAG: DNA-binding protein [Dehalococcoidia bacterium]
MYAVIFSVSDPITPYRTSRYITATDVDRAADALLRMGERPTVEKIRQSLGTGSPNTINPMLDAWWKRLASRLDTGPHALHRIPEAVAQITETLWLTALEEARTRAGQEQRRKTNDLERDRRETDLRRHVLSLREAEFEDQLKERARTIATLEEQVAALTRLLQTEQANRASALRRISTLESSLRETEARAARLFRRVTDAKPRTKPSKATPSRPPQRRKASASRTPKARPRRTPGPRRTGKPGRREEQLALRELRALRARLVPQAEARGIRTDSDAMRVSKSNITRPDTLGKQTTTRPTPTSRARRRSNRE